jgi:hypothetical protein
VYNLMVWNVLYKVADMRSIDICERRNEFFVYFSPSANSA